DEDGDVFQDDEDDLRSTARRCMTPNEWRAMMAELSAQSVAASSIVQPTLRGAAAVSAACSAANVRAVVAADAVAAAAASADGCDYDDDSHPVSYLMLLRGREETEEDGLIGSGWEGESVTAHDAQMDDGGSLSPSHLRPRTITAAAVRGACGLYGQRISHYSFIVTDGEAKSVARLMGHGFAGSAPAG